MKLIAKRKAFDRYGNELSILINTEEDVVKYFLYTITVESPASDEDLTIGFTNRNITISEMRAVIVGGSSVTWTVRHGTDRSATGNEVVTGGTTTTSDSSGSDVTTFDDATIIQDSFIWLETTDSNSEDELSVTIMGTVD